MVFAGQLTESLLDIILGGAFVHSQYFVIVYVSHIIYLLNFICFKRNKIHANWLCSVFILLSLQRIFRNYSKGNEGIGNHIQVFMLLVLLLPVVALCPVKAETTSEGPILIVTSYNPETRSISDNLSAFMDEYRQRGGKYTPIIESMNCKNLSEAYLWKSRMASILGKYKGKNRPSLVILLGQEAWSAYISQDTEIAKKTPSICGMVSVNGLVLPDDSIDTRVWEPESKNIYTDFSDYNIVAGYVYEYDVDKT